MKKHKLGRFSSKTLALAAALVLVTLALTTVIVMAQPDGAPATEPDSITVTKVAESATIRPPDRLAYSVVFSNSSETDIVLDTITDVLPDSFIYWGLAAGSDILEEPDDKDEPTIVWQGAYTVPATDTLTLRYWVVVPEGTQASETPYKNSVTAAYGETSVGPAESEITVVSPDISTVKTVTPQEIEMKDTVTYTVVWTNDGNADGVIEAISDTLPGGFEFESTLPGGTITGSPTGSTGTIVWTGPYTVEAGASVTLTYRVQVNTVQARESINEVVALIDGKVTEPAEATVTLSVQRALMPIVMRNYSPPRFTVSMSTDLATVNLGDPVIYTVEFTNEGSRPGTIADVRNIMPAGFSFLNMEPTSEVPQAPVNQAGTLIWTGPFEVGIGDKLTLVFKLKASEIEGDYVNKATATTSVGIAPYEPATTTIKVKEPFLLEEDFESGTDGWEPFLNYWRLYPEQWYTKNGAGIGGSTGLNHNFCLGVTDPRGCERGAHDALYMYQGTGAEDWQNYRLEAKLKLHDGEKGVQMGLWIRGKHRVPEDPKIDGKYVSGYYVVFALRENNSIILTRLRDSGSTAEHFSDPEAIAAASRPMVKDQWYNFRIDVVNNNIQVWLDGEKLIDVNDSTWGTGTIGFFAYKLEEGTWDDIVVTPLD